LPPGARHDLGAFAFATAARRAGLAVRYLGADVPLEDWLGAVRRTNARAVVLGVVISGDVRPASAVARAIHEAHPGVVIALGGRAASAAAKAALDRVVVLPDDLAGSVEMLSAELASAA
jgi:methanogenic corrinoid protein MtbC1